MPTDAFQASVLLPPLLVLLLFLFWEVNVMILLETESSAFSWGFLVSVQSLAFFFKFWPQTINHSGTAGVFYYVPAPGTDSLRYISNLLDTCSGCEAAWKGRTGHRRTDKIFPWQKWEIELQGPGTAVEGELGNCWFIHRSEGPFPFINTSSSDESHRCSRADQMLIALYSTLLSFAMINTMTKISFVEERVHLVYSL